MSDDIVHACPNDHDEIRLAERRRAGRQIAQVVIFRNDSPALRRRVKRDAGGFDPSLKFRGGVGPNHAGP